MVGSYGEGFLDVELDLLARQGSDPVVEGAVLAVVAPCGGRRGER